MLLVLAREVMDERSAVTMLLAASFGLVSGWIGWSLWRGPSFAVVLISLCVAAFLVLIWLITLVGERLSSPWSLIVPLGPAVAAVLTLMSRTTAGSGGRDRSRSGE